MNIKRILAACVCIFAAALSASVFAGAEPSPAAYVALGDSIAYGYGLSDIPKQSFVTLVAEELGIGSVNYAVNGMTSSGLLNALDNMDGDAGARLQLRNASLITVSIGSNDLLSKLTGILYMLPAEADAAVFATLEAELTSEQKLAEFDFGVESYRRNLPLIYARLREFNPAAQIIMTEFYNPYYGVLFGAFDFGSLSDEYIVRMNDVLHEGREEMDYKIASLYDLFNAPGRTNVDPALPNMDPHPNTAGHSAIAEAVLSAIDMTALRTEVPLTETAEDAQESTAAADTRETAKQTERSLSADTAPESDPGSQKSVLGTVILAAAAAAVFAVTGIIVSIRNKRA